MQKMDKVDKATLTRTIMLLIALINQLFGVGTIALNEEQVIGIVEAAYLVGSTLFTIFMSLWNWWKNNYVSPRGQAQKEVLKQKNLV